jgi:WD40 repeat protein
LTTLVSWKGHLKSVYPLAFIPADGEDFDDLGKRSLHERDLLITGSADCTARIWSLASGETLKVLSGHTAPIHAIVVDHERTNAIFTAGGDGLIMAFDAITGECMRKLVGHETAILALDTYKSMLYSASADKTSRAWVMEFGEETRVFRGSRSPVTCIRFFLGFGNNE